MIYLKSVLVGLLGLAVSAAAMILIEFVFAAIWIRAHGGDQSVFIRFSTRSPFIWGLALFIFASAFYWNYHRLSH
jgi:sterol desaturase/sphingolipid hydroxylase (fatty acid hydroxylase superfamily)